MKILLHPVFLLCVVLFTANQLLEKNGIFIPFIHAYLDDICCIPVLLTLASAILSLIYSGKNTLKNTYPLSLYQVILAVIYTAILFEIILPKYSPKYIPDVWDLFAYISGAFVYYRFINPAKTLAPAKQ